jgi:hypothetical protein
MKEEAIPSAVRDLARVLATPAPMRRGSVSKRFMKCGRKQCRCHQDAQARHGPYYSLTRMEGGKTRSRYLNAQQAALAEQQIEAGQAFRRRVEDYWEACEQWADARLSEPADGATEEAKKGASEKPSK